MDYQKISFPQSIKILADKLPEWVDPVKGTKLKSDVKNYAMTEGFSEQEIDMLMDEDDPYIPENINFAMCFQRFSPRVSLL
mgnify:CR=1 FL=1